MQVIQMKQIQKNTFKIYINTEFNMNSFENSKYQATYRLNRRSSIIGGVDVDNKWHLRYRIKYYY